MRENYRVVAFIVFGLRFVASYLIIFSFFFWLPFIGAELLSLQNAYIEVLASGISGCDCACTQGL